MVPSVKVTVPLGVPVAGLVTVAMKVTGCPNTDGFAVELSVVELRAELTVIPVCLPVIAGVASSEMMTD